MVSFERLIDLGEPQFILLTVLALLLPLSIFIGRRYVRVRRLQILDNLAAALDETPNMRDPVAPPPGLGLVRARYAEDAAEMTARKRALGYAREVGAYILPTAIFVLLSACGFALIVGLGGEWLAAAEVLLHGLRAEDGGDVEFAAATALVVGAGFVGAYIWSINYLILRIANFDLSPLSYLRTSGHILITVFAAWVLRQVIAAPGLGQGIAVAALLGIAFLSGLYPSLGVNVLIERLPAWLRIKREVEEGSKISRSFPLDLIDGIDPTIKFRLNQLEIADAQNLATANPIVLYVASPYGLIEIIDWIAQAQLMIELGPAKFLDARDECVRDMIAFLRLGEDDSGRRILKPLVFSEDADGVGDDALEQKLKSISTKLHVRHLVQWQNVVERQLKVPGEVADAKGARGGLAHRGPAIVS